MNSRLLTGTAIECRHAARGLGRAPGFAVAIVLVLGIAIAGMVTVTTAAYELFLRPLPFAQPDQLAHVTTYSRSMGFDLGFSPPMLAGIREQPMVVDLAAYQGANTVDAADGDSWQAASITHNLTQVLGVPAIAGRAFTAADGEPGALPVALISESVWRNRFGAAESAIGKEIVLDDRRVTVVGVLPDSFTVPAPATGIWEPLRYTPEELTNIGSFSGGEIVARLAPGYTPAQLEDAMRARFAAEEPGEAKRIREMMGLEPNVRGLREAWTAEQRQPLAIIGLASALVLAAALLNVAGLWLARLLERSHEQAIQAALGAGAWRRLARTVIEFMLLGAAAASLALAFTPLSLGWLKQLGMLDVQQPLSIAVGPVTIAITGAVLALSSLPVLLAAFWQQRQQRRSLVTGLSSGGRNAAGSGARARRVLIVAQVALAMSLLCAMGLLLRSWHGLLTEDLGFEARDLLVARINAPREPGEMRVVPDPTVVVALDALRALPGVTSVAWTNVAPFSRSESVSSIPVPGQEDRDTSVHSRNVGPDFFRTVGIPLLRGRAFEADDAETGRIVVDEYFASQHFADGGALGKIIRMPAGNETGRDSEIIGVAATVKYRAPDQQAERGTIYQLGAHPRDNAMAVIAANVPPGSLVDPAKSALERSLGPNGVAGIATMESMVRDTVRDREPQLVLLGLFGVETLALAAIGLFSLLAYSVRARTAEFGVRQAVGADASDIRRHVLGDAVRLLAAGLAIGIAGALIGGQLIANRLYEVSPADPVTWVAAAIVLAVVVLAAGLWPAERAARIEPTEALRHE
jgi:putative ABC transport system permease protein